MNIITCEHITSRVCRCDNCKRIMPFLLKYKFTALSGLLKGFTYVNLNLCEDCSNALSSLHRNVMEEGKPFIYVKDEFKELEDIEMEDKTINLCDTCIFEIPECKATQEGVDFNFGHGIGNDNVYKCKIYEMKNKEEI